MSEVITMPTNRIDPKSQDSLDALGLSEAADNCGQLGAKRTGSFS